MMWMGNGELNSQWLSGCGIMSTEFKQMEF